MQAGQWMYDTSGLCSSLKEFATAVQDGEATIAIAAILATFSKVACVWNKAAIIWLERTFLSLTQ